MTTTETPNAEIPNTDPTQALAECRAMLDAAPLSVLVEIRDALQVMRDQPATLVDADDPE